MVQYKKKQKTNLNPEVDYLSVQGTYIGFDSEAIHEQKELKIFLFKEQELVLKLDEKYYSLKELDSKKSNEKRQVTF